MPVALVLQGVVAVVPTCVPPVVPAEARVNHFTVSVIPVPADILHVLYVNVIGLAVAVWQ